MDDCGGGGDDGDDNDDNNDEEIRLGARQRTGGERIYQRLLGGCVVGTWGDSMHPRIEIATHTNSALPKPSFSCTHQNILSIERVCRLWIERVCG